MLKSPTRPCSLLDSHKLCHSLGPYHHPILTPMHACTGWGKRWMSSRNTSILQLRSHMQLIVFKTTRSCMFHLEAKKWKTYILPLRSDKNGSYPVYKWVGVTERKYHRSSLHLPGNNLSEQLSSLASCYASITSPHPPPKTQVCDSRIWAAHDLLTVHMKELLPHRTHTNCWFSLDTDI